MTEEPGPTVQVQVVIDANAPGALAQFWAVALGYKVQDPPPGFDSWPDALTAWGMPEEQWDDASAIVPLSGTGPRVFFQKVPERKTGKNRLHLDVGVGRGIADPEQRWARVLERVDLLVEQGAAVVDERRHEAIGDHWMVMTDPEGNEFCVQ